MLSVKQTSLVRLYLVWLYLFVGVIPAWPQPGDEEYQRAVQLFGQRDLTNARRRFLRVVELAPPALRSRYYLGRIALLESKPIEAVKWLEPIAAADPPVFDAAAQLGKAYFDAGEWEKAKAATERAISQAEWDGALHYRLARIFQQMGQSNLAQKEFAESVRLKSADRESVELLLECSNRIAKGEVADALRIRGQLMANLLLDPDVLVALGLAFAGAGMTEASLEPFETAASRDPNLFQARYNAGLALLKMGRASDAVAPLEASLRLAPDSADANSAIGVAYILEGRYRDAIPPLERCARLRPATSRTSMMLALAYVRTGAPAKAIPLLRDVIRESHQDPKAYFLLIEALNAAEKQGEALAVAQDAVRLFPETAQSHLAKAQQLARLGRYSDAGPEFRRTLELTPGQLDSLLGLAEVQQKQGDYSASLNTYQEALARESGNVTAVLGAARNLVLLNRIDEARQLLEPAVKAHEVNLQLHYELSRVYARLGERDLAAGEMRTVERLREMESKPR